MIILPDRRISHSKFLIPVPKNEWMLPSDYTYKDQFNNYGIRTRFYVRGVSSDGQLIWNGCFEDRDDYDAFLIALAKDTLKYEKNLWRLPTPEWHDGLGEDLKYEFVTTTLLTNTSAGLSYTLPTDWNTTNNAIYVIGGGATGGLAMSTTATAHSTGGGAGGFRGTVNYSVITSGSVPYTVGAQPAVNSRAASTSGTQAGAAGNPSSWNTNNLVGNGGGSGNGSTVSGAAVTIGTSGSSSSNLGSSTAAQGGSSGTSTFNGSATGGGGGAGTTTPGSSTAVTAAFGSSSVNATATNTGYAGGAGGNGAAAGLAGGGNGGTTTNNGGGGGGGGVTLNTSTNGGNGGTYGAGGGGVAIRSMSALRTATAGRGTQGLISVSYEPKVFTSLRNSPMLGM